MTNQSQHEDLSRDHVIETGSDRAFGFVFTAVFAIIAFWPIIFGSGSIRWWALAIAAAFLAVTLVKPKLLSGANKLWAGLGILIGKFVTPIVMGILFFLTVTPVGFLMRLTGKDPLRRKFDPEASSYWIEREPPGPEPDSMRNQF